jgi:hypothetical protein
MNGGSRKSLVLVLFVQVRMKMSHANGHYLQYLTCYITIDYNLFRFGLHNIVS